MLYLLFMSDIFIGLFFLCTEHNSLSMFTERRDLTCTFVNNTCGWKSWTNGLKWSQKVNENTGNTIFISKKFFLVIQTQST